MEDEGVEDNKTTEAAEDSGAEESPGPQAARVAPYAGAGGGSTLAQRVATVYLSAMLVSNGRPETNDLPVVNVAFQTDPEHDVDDLRVVAGTGSDELPLSVAVRRRPNFVRSHDKTQKLVASMLREVASFGADERARVVVAVAETRTQYEEVQELATYARENADAEAFYAQAAVEGRWSRQVRGRLKGLEELVKASADVDATAESVRVLTWQLLSRLWVVTFLVEAADSAGWSETANKLAPVARDGMTGAEVRDRILVKTSQYDSHGTKVDIGVLRREIHEVLAVAGGRTGAGWAVVDDLQQHAYDSVRGSIGTDTADGTPASFAVRRPVLDERLEEAISAAGSSQSALMVAGESGTGKSAAVLAAVRRLVEDPDGAVEAVVLNLRRLPVTSAELAGVLGRPFKDLLIQLSAPTRILVVDAADAASERHGPVLGELASAAAAANVGLVLVCADHSAEVARIQVRGHFPDPATETVDPLTDKELAAVAAAVPLLDGILRNVPDRSFLRRLVVLDLVCRSGRPLSGRMSAWECLEAIWDGLVRRNESTQFGSPEGRERALLAVAEHQLGLPAELRRYGSPEPAAVDTLRADRLLAPRSIRVAEPDFAHEEVRRYANAVLMVRGATSTEVLERAGAPRWALSAALLACEAAFLTAETDPTVAFSDAAAAYRRIGERYGVRWFDVPIEAALNLPNAAALLAHVKLGDSSDDAVGLLDVIRVAQQRHVHNGFVDIARTEPVAAAIVRLTVPWRTRDEVWEFLTEWFGQLSFRANPAGHPVRLALRERLLAHWEVEVAKAPSEDDAHFDEQIASVTGRPRRKRELPYELSDEKYIELMALLGADIGPDIDHRLRLLAADAPAFLVGAVDKPWSARAVAVHDIGLLADLAEAYYIDLEPKDWGAGEDGIRHHSDTWNDGTYRPADPSYGPFMLLLRYGRRESSIKLLNRMLNHAARQLAHTLSGLHSALLNESVDSEDSEDSRTTLGIAGEPRAYAGGAQAWCWYRGSTQGPGPCTSALLALERVADAWIANGETVEQVASELLNGCENVAMPGLVFGLVTRHLESAGHALDAYLAEPAVWEYELTRSSHETSGLSINLDQTHKPERRRWSPHQVAMALVLAGDRDRRDELTAVGERLVLNAVGTRHEEAARQWAGSLDIDRYDAQPSEDGVIVEVSPDPEMAESQMALEKDLAKVSEIYRIQYRYLDRVHGEQEHVQPTDEEIAADLAIIERLMSDAPQLESNPVQAAAQVARAAVIRAAETGELTAFGDHAGFAVDGMYELAHAFIDGPDQIDEGQIFGLGADRASALSLPALLLPQLAPALDAAGVTIDDLIAAGRALASKGSLETRLFLARACDVVWAQPCTREPCIHRTALDWLTSTLTGAAFGPWNQETQRRSPVVLEGDLLTHLATIEGRDIDYRVLDALIRGAGAAAASSACVADEARETLDTLLEIQARSLCRPGRRDQADGRGQHAAVSARALLMNADASQLERVRRHLRRVSTHPHQLLNLLHALAGAGAETEALAANARNIWPEVVQHVLALAEKNPEPFRHHTWGDWIFAALLPAPIAWARGIYSEVADHPIDWVDRQALVELLPDWVPHARGSLRCISALLTVLRELDDDARATLGLELVTQMCVVDGKVRVTESGALNGWLIEVKPGAERLGQANEWQDLVDRLVVAGNTGLAPFSV